jgi:hypothetical protein
MTGDPTAPPELTLPPQPDLTADQWEQIALFLFNRLDDIDTMSDVAKADNARYRRFVERAVVPRRFEVAETDGYRVVFHPPVLPPAIAPRPETPGEEDG